MICSDKRCSGLNGASLDFSTSTMVKQLVLRQHLKEKGEVLMCYFVLIFVNFKIPCVKC